MTDREFGELTTIDPREVWGRERKFTEWLSSNIDRLGNAIGKDLEVLDSFAPLGRFEVDILARCGVSGSEVIVENQLDSADSNHLGELLTYTYLSDPSITVWISSHFGDTYGDIISFLNNNVEGTTFLGVKLIVVKVSDSKPAPFFSVVGGPDRYTKQSRMERRSVDLSGLEKEGESDYISSDMEKEEIYNEYFGELVERLREEGLTRGTWGGKTEGGRFYKTGAGSRACRYRWQHLVSKSRYLVQLMVEHRSAEVNRKIINKLKQSRQDIEEEMGSELVWEEKPGRKNACITLYYPEDISTWNLADDDTQDRLLRWSVEMGKRFRSVFMSRLRSLSYDELRD